MSLASRSALLPLLAALCLAPVAAAESENAAEPAELATVTVFLDDGCPIARHHTLTLRRLHRQFASRGVSFHAWMPNASATAESARAFASEFELPFPVDPDPHQAMARRLDAATVPEVFVHDATGRLVYRGRINDRFAAVGRRRPAARVHDLCNVLRLLSAGETIEEPRRTEAIGCRITFTPDTEP